MTGEFWHVWIKLPEDVHLNSVIEAGIKALDIDAELDETSYQDNYED